MIVFHTIHFKSFPNVKNMFVIFIIDFTISQYIIKRIFTRQPFFEFFKAIPVVIEKNPFFLSKYNKH